MSWSETEYKDIFWNTDSVKNLVFFFPHDTAIASTKIVNTFRLCKQKQQNEIIIL